MRRGKESEMSIKLHTSLWGISDGLSEEAQAGDVASNAW